jgi:hypothetical protein
MIDWSSGASGRRFVGSIRTEFLRYKQLAEGALAQMKDDELPRVTTICWHVGGNLKSRFSDFLTTDGEKPWRNRESEFDERAVSRQDLLAQWEEGWATLLEALNELTDRHLEKSVTIRGNRLAVHEALHRALAHVSYHVGQIVLVAKELRGDDWKSLSIPRGGSEAYNQNPTKERPRVH